MRFINQCGLYVDKIKIFLKISGCGLYTGALNRPKIMVLKYKYHSEMNICQAFTEQLLGNKTEKLRYTNRHHVPMPKCNHTASPLVCVKTM